MSDVLLWVEGSHVEVLIDNSLHWHGGEHREGLIRLPVLMLWEPR